MKSRTENTQKILNSAWKWLAQPNVAFIVLLTMGFILRVYLSQYLTYMWDYNTWRGWGSGLVHHGFSNFYDSMWSDYMPGYLYVLWAVQKVNIAFSSIPDEILFKLPANIADVGISIIIYRLLKGRTSDFKAVLFALVYLFNPAVLSNSTFWGQVDSVHALPMLASFVLLLGRRFTLAVVLASVSFMIKPQSIVVFPFIGYLALRSVMAQNYVKFPVLRFTFLSLKLLSVAVVTIFLIALPFMSDGTLSFDIFGLLIKTFDFIKDRFVSSYDQYPFSSLNAFNLWAFYGFWKSDQVTFWGITYQRWGTIGFALSYLLVLSLFILYDLRKSSNGLGFGGSLDDDLMPRVFEALTIILFALFLVISRAHERHFFPTLVFFSLLTYRSSFVLMLYVFASLYYTVNMIFAYLREYPIGALKHGLFELYIPGIVLLAVVVFAMLFYNFSSSAVSRFRNRL